MTSKYMQSSEPLTPEDFHITDWFLRMLVNACNHTDTAIPITLNVGGVLISGALVGGDQYFNGFADDAKRFGADEELAATCREYAKMYTGVKGYEPEPDEHIFPQYIHLQNARFIHPGGGEIPKVNGVWWRGRLEEIDGFVLGGLTTP